MAIKLGNIEPVNFMLGNKQIERICQGEEVVWRRLPYKRELAWIGNNENSKITLPTNEYKDNFVIEFDFDAVDKQYTRGFFQYGDYTTSRWQLSFSNINRSNVTFSYLGKGEQLGFKINTLKFPIRTMGGFFNVLKPDGRYYCKIIKNELYLNSNLVCLVNISTTDPHELFSTFDFGLIYKMYSVKINNFDLIPVLDFNNVPCWYDKNSRQLFYNTGTEDFEYSEL